MSMTAFILIVGLVLLTMSAISDAATLLKWMYEHDNSRRTWTGLTDRELEYCVNDVRCLVEAKTQLDGDNSRRRVNNGEVF